MQISINFCSSSLSFDGKLPYLIRFPTFHFVKEQDPYRLFVPEMEKTMIKTTMAVAATTAVAVAVSGMMWYQKLYRKKEGNAKLARAEEMVEELERTCASPLERLRQLADAMEVEMHAGLALEGGSRLKMLLTYVDSLPTGYFVSILCSILYFG